MALVIVLFLCSWIGKTESSPPTVTDGELSLSQRELSLSQRVGRLELMVTQLGLVVKQYEGEKNQWETEREYFKEQRAEWQKAQRQWNLDQQALTDDIAALKDKLEKASIGNFKRVKTSARDVVPRSDDTNPLEPVVAQMAQRLTQVSAEVQALKTSHSSDLQALQSSHNADIKSVQNNHSADIQALRDANVHQDQAIQEAGSSVYVRWGSSACPNSASLVYSGVVGGSHSIHSGGAANPLCMSMSPVMASRSVPSDFSALYGAEYQTYDSHNNKDPVCSACRVPRPTVLMLPGTNRCEAGWTTEYSGYLMAGAYSQTSATQYICVDSTFESRIGGDPDQNGYALFFSVAHCGSLPCQPYVNGGIITCAVCSK